MPITVAPDSCVLTVRRVGADDKVKKHLSRLGIYEGCKITVLSNSGGNVIVEVKEGRLCLDKNTAGKISVS